MSPETDDAFRQRILQVINPDLRADAMIATGYGLDGLGSLNGLRRKGLPDGSFPDPVAEAFRKIEQEQSLLPIAPMFPGERPTQPGWYVRRDISGDHDIVEISADREGGLNVQVVGVEMWDTLASELERGCTFIARIYPDRIEGNAP